MSTIVGLLCCCGSSTRIESDQLIDVQAERAAWDRLHAGCLPVVADEVAALDAARRTEPAHRAMNRPRGYPNHTDVISGSQGGM